jgi:YspA, cpYpsA-related SLOG family
MRQPFRLLVTGSRTWDDIAVIEHALAAILARHPEGVLLVHGASPRGTDAIAAAYAARTPGYRIEAHRADWRRHGRAAGQLRNAAMIGLGADGCAAFLRGASPGTTATIRLARAAGIPVWLHRRAADAEPQPGA